MKITLSDKIIAWLALLSGLTISAVAIWYSVAGLVSIFAAAMIPIIVMGVALEVSKLIATVWLKINWHRAPVFIRTYLLVAIAILMVITSMGIFGFLSKAHSDQSLVSGDVQAKIAVYDEKIKTAKDNIDANRKALKQMDEAVDQVMGRSTTETGADKAVAIRRAQVKERSRLQSEITAEQKTIASLNEERAPIAAEVRKVEAEVGPIKYIAAFVYGDNPDANVLEKAVTWVIIIIVSVFDPLAVILLLASQYSFQWFRKQEEDSEEDVTEWFREGKERARQLDREAANDAEGDSPTEPESIVDDQPLTVTEHVEEKELSIFEKHPYLLAPWVSRVPDEFRVEPQVYRPEVIVEDTVPEKEVDDENLDDFEESEKAAIKAWKHDHPDTSLKLQRKLLEKGIITELPWLKYLKPTADYADEAAEEAAKWAEEQSKKKDSNLAGEGRIATGQENQRDIGYVQNAEQTGSTLWQRVKAKKDDK